MQYNVELIAFANKFVCDRNLKDKRTHLLEGRDCFFRLGAKLLEVTAHAIYYKSWKMISSWSDRQIVLY
jgi:hypothetical protein